MLLTSYDEVMYDVLVITCAAVGPLNMCAGANDIEPDDGGHVSAEKLWQMKREAQARDREAIAQGKLPPRAVLFIKPELIEGASIMWSEGSLNDD